jgi:hypothetical protein
MYIPYCESVEPARKCPVRCRDLKDQPLLDLAHGGDADFLVTGDEDLLALAGVTLVEIVSPAPYFEIIASTPKESARAPPLRLSLLYQRLQAAIPYFPQPPLRIQQLPVVQRPHLVGQLIRPFAFARRLVELDETACIFASRSSMKFSISASGIMGSLGEPNSSLP